MVYLTKKKKIVFNIGSLSGQYSYNRLRFLLPRLKNIHV